MLGPRTPKAKSYHLSTVAKASVLAAVCLLLSGPLPAAPAQSSLPAWSRWEQALTSSKTYANPYAEVSLSVTYTGPGGATYRAAGFWDGGSTFRIRFMFPSAGTWSWRTSCSDTSNGGLHNQNGQVSVGSPGTQHTFARRGTLRVSGNNRYLEHWDGTPFLWVADTSWQACQRATQADFETWVDHRRARNFSVLVLGCTTRDTAADDQDTSGNTPFLGSGVSKWNPVFWQGFDRKVRYANDQGLYVVVTGLVKSRMANASMTEHRNFARNLTARFAGMFVSISPRQNWGKSNIEGGSALNAIGTEVNNANPLALVTEHTDRGPGDQVVGMPEHAIQLHQLSTTDYSGVQTGPGSVGDNDPVQLGESSRATIEWITAVVRATPTKPVVNLEGVYDQGGNATVMARRGGYLSYLSGGCGFTSSTVGIWAWGKYPFNSTNYGSEPVAQALNRPYATYLNYLAQFLRGFQWWRLSPRQDLILNQTSDWATKMVFARASQGDLAAAFLPNNADIRIDMSAFPTPMKARWFNPLSNAYQDGPTAANSGAFSFAKPASWSEAALVLTPSGSPPPPPPPPPPAPPGELIGHWKLDETSGTWQQSAGARGPSS